MKLKTMVLNRSLPLLLSLQSLQRAKANIDLSNGTLTMGEKRISLEFSSAGHLLLPICSVDLEQALMTVGKIDNLDKSQIWKLHRQFGHCSQSKLTTLLRSAGYPTKTSEGLVKSIIQECGTCVKFGRGRDKPAVSLPLSQEFNETIAMDLHKIEDKTSTCYYLHIIDLFSKFSAAGVVFSKTPEEIFECFVEKWISVFGPPLKILTDNGGEFNNHVFRTFGDNFNVKIITTAAESPWSNGICERHNQTLTESMQKVRDDQKCDVKIALACALIAKNSLLNITGFSHQIVFGRNPKIPSLFDATASSLEGTTSSSSVADFLNSLQSAREAYTMAENSERIRRALRAKVRDVVIETQPGDEVFYKRNADNLWRGPGTVVGSEGPVIFVKHGGGIVKVHKTRLRHSREDLNPQDEQDKAASHTCQATDQRIDAKTSDSEDGEEILPSSQMEFVEQLTVEQSDDPKLLTNKVHTNGHNASVESLPKKNDKVTFSTSSSEDITHKVKILGYAGKIGKNGKGKHRNWLNVEYLDGEAAGQRGCVNWETVNSWKPDGENDVECSEESESRELQNESALLVIDDFKEAKNAEIDNWLHNNVFLSVEAKGQSLVGTRWVLTEKNGKKKARLVAKGFQDSTVDTDPCLCDSPTCSKESLRVAFCIILSNSWSLGTLDVKSAFLQGLPMSREVFLLPPPEYRVKNQVWKLLKCVYGLNDASRNWFLRVKKFLLSCGLENSKHDACVFFYQIDNKLHGIILFHVDDFVWGGSTLFKQIIAKFKAEFLVGTEENGHFQYLGTHILQTRRGIEVNQTKYIENLAEIAMTIDRNEQNESKALIAAKTALGQLQWIATQTRPDLAANVSELVHNINARHFSEVNRVNKLIRDVKFSKMHALTFHVDSTIDKCKLILYTDASLGNNLDGSTQGGVLLLLQDNKRNHNILFWQSRKLKRVVHGTLSSETIALVEGLDIAITIRDQIQEVTTFKLDIDCFTDSRSLLDSVKSLKNVSERRLRVDIAGIRELAENGDIKLYFVDTGSQFADILTKYSRTRALAFKRKFYGTSDVLSC